MAKNRMRTAGTGGGSGEPFHSRFVSLFYRHLAVVDLPIESDIIASRAKRIGLKIHIAQLLYCMSSAIGLFERKNHQYLFDNNVARVYCNIQLKAKAL